MKLQRKFFDNFYMLQGIFPKLVYLAPKLAHEILHAAGKFWQNFECGLGILQLFSMQDPCGKCTTSFFCYFVFILFFFVISDECLSVLFMNDLLLK